MTALVVAVGFSLPAEAKKRKGADKQVEAEIPDPSDGEPMTLVVSLSQQKLDVYRGVTLITSSGVSTGMRGHATKAGVFSILEKRRLHHSNLYSGAPMPWMNRITWSGTALHAGVLPGYPASHGCIRLPFSFAPKLYKITTVGDNVIVARDRPAPKVIEHPNLFQPLPAPAVPAIVKEEAPPEHHTRNEIGPQAPVRAYRGMLARANLSGSATDVPSSLEAEAVDGRAALALNQDPAAVEDTRAHAFDPSAAPAGKNDSPAKATTHALDEANAPEPSIINIAKAPDASVAEVPAPSLSQSKEVEAPPAAAPTNADMTAATAVPPAAAPINADNAAATEAEPVPGETASIAAKPAPAPAAIATATQEPAPMPSPTATPLTEADGPLSAVAAKLVAGAKEAAVQAAEPRSTAPLRILVTRRTKNDRIIGVQRILSERGYLTPQDFDGTLGRATVNAIKEFQKANGMPETGAFNDELMKKVYEVAGRGEPPTGHLYIRQEFGRVLDTPVTFKDPETPLGTHIFTAMKFAPGETSTRWMAMSLQGDDSAAALDRLEIPSDLRKNISERLTPGSSLIIADTAINSAGLSKGNDFVVWAKETPAKITAASLDGDAGEAKPRKKKARNVRRPNYDYSYRYQRSQGFPRGPGWPW